VTRSARTGEENGKLEWGKLDPRRKIPEKGRRFANSVPRNAAYKSESNRGTRTHAHTYAHTLRCANKASSDSYRMLTSSSACSRGNQPAKRCKNVLRIERAPRASSALAAVLYHRADIGIIIRKKMRIGNSRSSRGEEKRARARAIASREFLRIRDRRKLRSCTLRLVACILETSLKLSPSNFCFFFL